MVGDLSLRGAGILVARCVVVHAMMGLRLLNGARGSTDTTRAQCERVARYDSSRVTRWSAVPSWHRTSPERPHVLQILLMVLVTGPDKA